MTASLAPSLRGYVLNWVDGEGRPNVLDLQSIPKELVANARHHFSQEEIGRYLQKCFAWSVSPNLFFAEGSLNFINRAFWSPQGGDEYEKSTYFSLLRNVDRSKEFSNDPDWGHFYYDLFEKGLKIRPAIPPVTDDFRGWLAHHGKEGTQVVEETARQVFASSFWGATYAKVLEDALGKRYWKIEKEARPAVITKLIRALTAGTDQNRSPVNSLACALRRVSLESVEVTAVHHVVRDVDFANDLQVYSKYSGQLTEQQKQVIYNYGYANSKLLTAAIKKCVEYKLPDNGDAYREAIRALYPQVNLEAFNNVIHVAKTKVQSGRWTEEYEKSFEALQTLIRTLKVGLCWGLSTDFLDYQDINAFYEFCSHCLIKNTMSGDPLESYFAERLNNLLFEHVRDMYTGLKRDAFTADEITKIYNAIDNLSSDHPNKALFTRVASKAQSNLVS